MTLTETGRKVTEPRPIRVGMSRVRQVRPRPSRGTRPKNPTLSIVIPTLNEADNLPFVFSTLAGLDAELVVVDGRSSDDTTRVAKALRPDVKLVHETRKGKGIALRSGFAACTGDIIVMLDADGSADGREIPRFVEALCNGADFAKGSRFVSGGGSADITRFRQFGNRGLNLAVNVLFGAHYTDLCYGYNAFWRDCLDYLDVDCEGFEVETLMNIRAIRSGLVIAEVPSHEAGRIHGHSNLRAISDGVRVLRTIVEERRSPAPLRDPATRPLLDSSYADRALPAPPVEIDLNRLTGA
jgi:glycosyltransferase involved in cell wall biosynthesis